MTKTLPSAPVYTGSGTVSSIAPGRTIDRFELVSLIGRGGMGEVWEATDPSTGERVALKLIQDSRASEPIRRRFAREVRAASKVRHPAVVDVHDVIETDEGDPVMVMELLQGESLAERLAREPEMSVEMVAGIMLPVVSAVGSAHAHGIVHRDLKPENIFLVRGEEGDMGVRVLDFGIAKLVADEDQTETSAGLTTTGAILGTPCYMAPEQVFGEKDVDHRVDIWAIGIILYQMLTGLLPTKADNVGQVLKIIVTRGIWPLREAAPDLPEALTEMVDVMLAKDRDDRPGDLREVQAVLETFAGDAAPSFGPPISERLSFDSTGSGVTPAPMDGGTTVDPLADTAAARSASGAPTTPKREPRPWGWLAVGAVAVAVLGVQLTGPSEIASRADSQVGAMVASLPWPTVVMEEPSEPVEPEPVASATAPSASVSTAPAPPKPDRPRVPATPAPPPSPAPEPIATASVSAAPPSARPQPVGGIVEEPPDELGGKRPPKAE